MSSIEHLPIVIDYSIGATSQFQGLDFGVDFGAICGTPQVAPLGASAVESDLPGALRNGQPWESAHKMVGYATPP
jgi:hypothetical protein